MAIYYSPKMEELTRIIDEQREHIQDLKRQLDEEKNKLKHVQEEKVTRITCSLALPPLAATPGYITFTLKLNDV